MCNKNYYEGSALYFKLCVEDFSEGRAIRCSHGHMPGLRLTDSDVTGLTGGRSNPGPHHCRSIRRLNE